MAYDKIILNWNYNFKGELFSPTGYSQVGDSDDGLYPYHLLFGALGSCFYSTFLSVAKKMRLTFDEAKIEVSGYKTDPELKVLDVVDMKMTIKNASDQDKILRSAKLGTQYCSIHEMIEKSAKINLNVEFVE